MAKAHCHQHYGGNGMGVSVPLGQLYPVKLTVNRLSDKNAGIKLMQLESLDSARVADGKETMTASRNIISLTLLVISTLLLSYDTTGSEKGRRPSSPAPSPLQVHNKQRFVAAARATMEVEKVLCMNGGDGETSYAKNSSLQRDIIEAARSAVEEAVLDLYSAFSFPDKLSVADLGCSSGPNALSVVVEVADAIEKRSRRLGQAPPELQLFLNDLPGNDFNSVFVSLQDFFHRREAACGGRELRLRFIAGVPGSFYGRLFQTRTIHFFHSSSSLHWLSQVPAELQDRDMPLNRRNVYITKESPPSVIDAYTMQFQKDFSDFLKSRAEEMVIGGRMVLILLGRTSSDPASEEVVSHWTLLSQVLMDMVQEGYIAGEKVDTFNLPYYEPCAMEVECEIQREGSFSLKSLEIFEVDWDASEEHDNYIKHSEMLSNTARSQANCIRAVTQSMLVSHFGAEIIEDLFLRYGKALEDYLSRKKTTVTNLVVSLL